METGIASEVMRDDLESSYTLVHLVSGGDSGAINMCVREKHSGTLALLKINKSPQQNLAESLGMQTLFRHAQASQESCALVPRVISSSNKYVLLEWVQLLSKSLTKIHGAQLANVLKASRGRQTMYGWTIDGYCGSFPQKNTPMHGCWEDFFLQSRLRFQIDICADAQIRLLFDRAERSIREALAGAPHGAGPVFLHGDLWSGNAALSDGGQLVIYDPAPYWGHWEAELGIMTMFGGFSDEFLSAFARGMGSSLDQVAPRIPIYQLYHHLNHFNMFGGGYRQSCVSILRQFGSST